VTNNWKSEFAYDGLRRRRIRKEFAWRNNAWAQTSEVRYIYDGTIVIQERDGCDLPAVSYTRVGEALLARSESFAANPQHSYYHADGNGNVTALIDKSQLVVAEYVYDPFGNILAKAGPLADANQYRFATKEYHPNSGLVCYPYRFYDPSLQRWANRDPVAELGFAVLSELRPKSTFGKIGRIMRHDGLRRKAIHAAEQI